MKQEASHSGLVRTLGKRVRGNPPRVRISPPPQIENAGGSTPAFFRLKLLAPQGKARKC